MLINKDFEVEKGFKCSEFWECVWRFLFFKKNNNNLIYLLRSVVFVIIFKVVVFF